MIPSRRFDSNAIPDFDRGGRLGEIDRDEPEERQGSSLATDGDESSASAADRAARPFVRRETEVIGERRRPPDAERRRHWQAVGCPACPVTPRRRGASDASLAHAAPSAGVPIDATSAARGSTRPRRRRSTRP